MKNRWKLITASAAAAFMTMHCQVWAQPTTDELEDIQAEILSVGEASETGYIPVYTEGVQFGTGSSSLRRAASLPAQYDLRDYGLATAVKNQGSTNMCWAYSSLASAESGLIGDQVTDTAIDLSEYHLAWTTYNGTNADATDKTSGETFLPQSGQNWMSNGGNRYYATGTLARWYGVELESNVGTTPSASCRKSSVSHLDQVYFLPEFNTYSVSGSTQTHTGYQESARAVIKQILMTEGAVEIGINSSSAYYDADTKSYYCSDASDCTADHSVVLVGWDDTYETAAEEAGAWLFKNSWGTSVGDGGYYWVSYYDMSIDNPTFYELEDTVSGGHAYSSNYQYDGTGGGLSQYRSSSKLSGANVFTATRDEAIGEVGFYTMQADTQYTIKVYTDLTGSTPDTGTCVLTMTGSQTYAGYHTVELTTPVEVASGNTFAVEVTQITDGTYRVPMEGASSSSKQTTISAGESFLGSGKSWTDASEYNLSNVCIKAFGNETQIDTGNKTEQDNKTQESTTEKNTTKDKTTTAKPSVTKTKGYWVLDSKGWWYNNGNGTWPANCWKKIDGIWYAFNAAGYMRTGWFLDGNTWYYLSGSGAMQTGWLLDRGTWYYLSGSGAMQTGWLLDRGTWYYLSASGAMQTGWLLDRGTWYYLSGSGAMQTGWYQVSGKWYYSYASGAMAANTWIGKYYVDRSGAWRP